MGTTRVLALLALGLLTSSCQVDVMERVQLLEERQVPACIYTLRYVLPFVAQREIAATGGMTIVQCHEFR